LIDFDKLRQPGAILEVNIEYSPPPIPIRDFDFIVTSVDYEPGDIIGFGKNKADALWDFTQQLRELLNDRILL